MKKQGRWNEESSNVRIADGNQSAEGEWGFGKSYQKSRCVHRGQNKRHYTSHATSALFMSHNPGVQALGNAIRHWLRVHMDATPPLNMFSRSGRTGTGAKPGDDDAARIVGSRDTRVQATSDPQKRRRKKSSLKKASVKKTAIARKEGRTD